MSLQQTHHLTFGPREVTKRYVSWERDEPGREWAALGLLAGHAPGLAPTPLRRGSVDGAPYVVMSRLPGAPLGEKRVTAEQVAAWGAALRRLFSVPVDAVRAAGLDERVNGPSVFAAMVREWAGDDHDLAACADSGLVAEGLGAARDWLASPASAPRGPLDPVLGLADGNLGNLLWDGGAVRLVDFEDAGLSDPAYEVADCLEHVTVRVPGGVEADALISAAGLTAEQAVRVAAYRPLMAAFWMVMLLPGNAGFARNPPGTTEGQARHLLALLSG